MHVSLMLWLGGGAVLMALVWFTTRARLFNGAKVPLRIAALVLIFTPTVYLGHPAMIQPVWITIFWDGANAPTAVLYWVVAALIVSGVWWLISKGRQQRSENAK